MRWAALFAGGGALLVLGSLACQDDFPVSCGEIPAGGCPASSLACGDPLCASLYACEAGSWQLTKVCANDGSPPPREAGPPRDSSTDVSFDASIDAPPGSFGGPGCEALQTPDCSLGLGLACTSGGCCGCEDLFVCEGGGWQLWGSCLSGRPVPR